MKLLNKITEIGILLVILTSPFGIMLKLSPTSSMLTVPKMLALATIIWWILTSLITRRRGFFLAPFRDPILIIIWLFIILSFITILISTDIKNSIKELFRISALYLYVILIIDNIRDRKQLNRALSILLIAGMFAGSCGVYEFVSKKSVLSLVGQKKFLNTRDTSTGEFVQGKKNQAMTGVSSSDVSVRIQGPFDDPNHFATFLNIILAILICQFFITDSKWKKLYLIGLSGLLLFDLIETGSRGGAGGFAFSFIFLFIYLPIKYKEIITGVAIFLILSSLPFYKTIEDHLPDSYKIFHLTSVSGFKKDPRTNAWMVGLNIIEQHPVIGIGFGNFEKVYDRYWVEGTIHEAQPAQNIIIQIWAEGGILSLIIFLLIMAIILKRLIMLMKCDDKYLRITGAAIFAALIGLSILIMTQENIWEQEFVWELFGFTIILSYIKEDSQHAKI